MSKQRTVTLLILTLLAAVVLAACDALPGAGGATLTGTVNKLDRSALPENATVEVDLLRQSTDGTPDTVIASTSFPTEGNQVPFPFEIEYNPDEIDPNAVYFTGARVLTDGQLIYVNAGPVPVLTQGAAAENVEVMLTPFIDTDAAPAEGTAPEGGAPAPVPGAGDTVLTGSATSAVPFAFPADSAAYLQVEIREPNLADAPAVATTQIPVAGLAFPIAFQLPFDRAGIDPVKTYVVDGRIIDNNQLLFSGQGGVPVLTNGAPTADVQLPLFAGVSTGPAPIETDGSAPVANAITGQATSALPYTFGPDSQAYLQVELREPNLADALAAAFTRIPMAGMTFPIPFELAYDPAAVDMSKTYVLDGRVVDGNEQLFTGQGGVPVLTNGAPSAGVQLPLYVTPSTGPAPIDPVGSAGGGGGLLTGSITTDAPVALDPSVVLVIDLREAGTTGQPLVSISQMLAGAQFPLSFEVPFVPGQIDPNKDYVIGARLLQGDQVLFASPAGVPVLTKGAPTTGVAVNIPPQ